MGKRRETSIQILNRLLQKAEIHERNQDQRSNTQQSSEMPEGTSGRSVDTTKKIKKPKIDKQKPINTRILLTQ